MKFTALRQFLRHLSWNHVSVIYTDDEYGKNSLRELTENFEKDEVCVEAHLVIKHPGESHVSFTLSGFVNSYGKKKIYAMISGRDAQQ